MIETINPKDILTPKQKRAVRESVARLNICEGAVRSGKTVGFLWRWILFIATAPRDGELIMIGRSLGTLYRNVVRPMQDLLGAQMRYFSGKKEIHIWDRVIFLFGAHDESSEGAIRGLTVAGACGDELTLWPESFFTMLLSRMSVDGAQFFGTTNPDSPYHYLKTNYLDRTDLDLYKLHFELDDNTKLSERFKNNLKKEYVGLWYKRFILGLWCQAEGSIYDFFENKEPFVIPAFKLPLAKEHVIGVDYGTGNPTAFIDMGINNNMRPKVWAAREYYYDSRKTFRQKTDEEYCDDFVEFAKPIRNSNFTKVFIDPSAKSFRLALERRLFQENFFVKILGDNDEVFAKVDNSVIDGIRTQAAMLKNGLYAVSSNCPRTIEDYFAYIWDAKQQKMGKDEPDKTCGADHTKDAERYPLQTIYGEEFVDLERLTTW